MALRIDRLVLYQFRNYEKAELNFETAFTCLTGPNGAGKTNLLDAVYYCGFCRGSRMARDDAHRMHDREGFRIEGHFQVQAKPLKVEVRYRETQPKEVWCNGERYDRLSEHIGRIPIVSTGPEDLALVDGYAEERRRFLDGALSTENRTYLQGLIRYNRALTQRNALLRQSREGRHPDRELLFHFAATMEAAAEQIQPCRELFIRELEPLFLAAYRLLSGEAERPVLQWKTDSPSGTGLRDLLEKSLPKDVLLGRSGAGPHRDDLNLLLDGHPARLLGSQGQKKTLLYALRLAQWQWLGKRLGFAPLLLLDDVFDKLDRHRVTALFRLLAETPEAQVLITDTNLNRVEEVFEQIGVSCQSVAIEPGRIAAS